MPTKLLNVAVNSHLHIWGKQVGTRMLTLPLQKHRTVLSELKPLMQQL